MIKVRKAGSVRLRKDVFGGVVYVPERDDFFALDHNAYSAVNALAAGWVQVRGENASLYRALASLGICNTEPVTKLVAYSGPSFIGKFIELPTVTDPLVLNCFSTAHCPLMCRYCHADDLMQAYRDRENSVDIENVISTASMIPSMVAVITGGDPLSSPERSAELIERLAKQKSIVVDTSGVGDISSLLPVLKAANAHVRVSLDSISEINDKVRPANPRHSTNKSASRLGARATIQACLNLGIPVTVQTVISSYNENFSELRDLRDAVCRWGVRNWVLHVAIRGGIARKVEAKAEQQTRRRGILPSPKVYGLVAELIADTVSQGLMLDIRCTDTDQTPNSVLLVASNGDLFTEGLAHHGKVPLYRAGDGRPDLVKSLWHHVDRFGHARRYFNWNPWLNVDSNLEDICFKIPRTESLCSASAPVVETEAKYPVRNCEAVRDILARIGFSCAKSDFQRDEYYDRSDGAFSSLDFVIRLRESNGVPVLGLKGPRFFTDSGEYSRVELEFEPKSASAAVLALSKKSLYKYWFFEKRRVTFSRSQCDTTVCIDEIPKLGFYLEIEGGIQGIREIHALLCEFLGPAERRNYAELVSDYFVEQGADRNAIHGAEFDQSSG